MSKALLNQKLMTELFGDVPVEGKNEEGREENSAQFSSYRQAPYRQELEEEKTECTFNQFVMVISTYFHIGKEQIIKDGEFVNETKRIWFTVEEAVKSVLERGYGYHVTAEQAKKYLDSLVSQGFFESREGKYHKLMFCYHLSNGTCFFIQGVKDSSRLAVYQE